MRVWLASQDTGVIDQELGGKVVGAVDDEVIVGNDAVDICRRDPFLVSYDLDVRIDGFHLLAGRFHLRLADIRGEMDHLALQVGKIDVISIRNTNGSHPGSRQIEGDRSAKTTCADDQHPAVKQLLLPFAANLFQNYVPRVAFYLGFGEHNISFRKCDFCARSRRTRSDAEAYYQVRRTRSNES